MRPEDHIPMLTSYNVFVRHLMLCNSVHSTNDRDEILKYAGRQWKLLSDDIKQGYATEASWLRRNPDFEFLDRNSLRENFLENDFLSNFLCELNFNDETSPCELENENDFNTNNNGIHAHASSPANVFNPCLKKANENSVLVTAERTIYRSGNMADDESDSYFKAGSSNKTKRKKDFLSTLVNTTALLNREKNDERTVVSACRPENISLQTRRRSERISIRNSKVCATDSENDVTEAKRSYPRRA